jgi:hypothetical protein
MFQPNDSTTLTNWLHRNHIDTTSWGRGGAKRVENLLGEILRGETVLYEDPPRRVVCVTQIWVQHGDFVLVEEYQTFEDGSTRQVNTLPSEKMQPDESPRQAALRCLNEELQIQPDEVKIVDDYITCREEEKPAFSYPGLHTRYTLYQVPTVINTVPDRPFSTVESNHHGSDPVVVHHWTWIPVAEYLANQTASIQPTLSP